VLLPLFGCAFILLHVVKIVLGFIRPPLAFLSNKYLGHVAAVDLASIVVLLLLCFLTGLFVTTSLGQALGRWLESNVLDYVPGFRLFQSLSLIVFGQEETKGTPVIVRMDDNRQVGFLVEEHSASESIVYLPSAPQLMVGVVVIVETERIEKLNVPRSQAARCLTSFGLGTSALLADKELPASNVVTRPPELAERSAE